ncbi:hypothetical protein K7432_010896 [Basidiobolus ranarum]|uniref:Uncharacterized protein n=1 Tax=Basidiobolus ranarum TaxID=34480 RepID=A0ABR2VUR6_9FUNG
MPNPTRVVQNLHLNELSQRLHANQLRKRELIKRFVADCYPTAHANTRKHSSITEFGTVKSMLEQSRIQSSRTKQSARLQSHV